MKSALILLGCIVGFVLTFILTTHFFGSAILRGPWPGLLKLYVVLFAQPKDYYDELVSEEFDISKTGLVKRFEFRHKYEWNHMVEIAFTDERDSKVYYQHRYKLNAVLKLDFYVDGRLVLSRVIKKEDYSVASGGGRRHNNYSLIIMYYKCPDDLPRDKLITGELTIIEGDKNFQDTYGPLTFIIRKMSDL